MAAVSGGTAPCLDGVFEMSPHSTPLVAAVVSFACVLEAPLHAQPVDRLHEGYKLVIQPQPPYETGSRWLSADTFGRLLQPDKIRASDLKGGFVTPKTGQFAQRV